MARTAWILLVALALLGSRCGTPIPGDPPQVSVTLHGVEDDLKGLLVVPSQGLWIVNASAAAGSDPVDPDTWDAFAQRWGGPETAEPVALDHGPGGLVAALGPNSLTPGTWTVTVWVLDAAGRVGLDELSFAVRSYAGTPPIGQGQDFWFDFTSDRDGVPGPDFPVDLQAFGLGSAAQPSLSAVVEEQVVAAVLSRASQVYHEADGAGLGFPDPVRVDFYADDPGGGQVTRICIGGPDPSGQGQIGSILIDPNNGNRASVECGTIPPTGIFPRELLTYQNQGLFQSTFDPLMTSRGGTPVGEHVLDPVVLHPAFDPGDATPQELARYQVIQTAVTRFADALGSVTAHEAGHALGLVAPGPQGIGLHGGTTGAVFSHDVTSDGTSSPAPNYLMKHGGSFNFARLAGLGSHPLPFLRALDFAYLRDRVMTDPRVTVLLPPPDLAAVSHALITTSTKVTVTGAGFAATPALRLVNPGYTYNLVGETLLSEGEMTAWINPSQSPAGLYDLLLENPDGQTDVLPGAVTVD